MYILGKSPMWKRKQWVQIKDLQLNTETRTKIKKNLQTQHYAAGKMWTGSSAQHFMSASMSRVNTSPSKFWHKSSAKTCAAAEQDDCLTFGDSVKYHLPKPDSVNSISLTVVNYYYCNAARSPSVQPRNASTSEILQTKVTANFSFFSLCIP